MYKKSIILASCVAVATGAWYAGAAKVDVTHFVPQKPKVSRVPDLLLVQLTKSVVLARLGLCRPTLTRQTTVPWLHTKKPPIKEGPFDLYPARISESYALRATIEGQ